MVTGLTFLMVPVPINVPPHEPENHRVVVPDPPIRVKVTIVVGQTKSAEAVMEVGATGKGLTFMVTETQAELPQVGVSQRP